MTWVPTYQEPAYRLVQKHEKSPLQVINGVSRALVASGPFIFYFFATEIKTSEHCFPVTCLPCVNLCFKIGPSNAERL